MGVDLATYRAKIGTFRHSFGVDVVSVDCYVNFTGGLKTVGSVLFIGILLLIAGIESNPGPPKKQDVLEAKRSHIKVSGLPVNVDTETLVKIFENITGQAGGAVKRIEMNVEDQSSIIEFEDSKVVELVIQNQPILVLGTEVDISVYNGDSTFINDFTTGNVKEENSEIKAGGPVQSAIAFFRQAIFSTTGSKKTEIPKTTKIKVTGIPDMVDEDMLEMFFENTKKQGGGKVLSVTLDKQKKMAIIEFEEHKAALNVLKKQPIILFGADVCISIYDEEEPESCIQTKIKVTGIPDNIDEDMLEMFFENTKKQGGGKVNSVNLNKHKKMAVIDFEEPEAVLKVMEKQPITMFGAEVCVIIYDEEEPDTCSPTKIKVTGLPEHVDKDMLEMFFENTKKQGGGKVKSVKLNKQKKMAVIEFAEPKAVVKVLEKLPIVLLGANVCVSIYEDEEEPETCSPTKIKVTGLPENVDEDMLEMFFENTKRQGGGTVKSVKLNKQKKTAVIDFEEPEAVLKVLEKQPISLFGADICVSIHDKEEPETCGPTKIKVTGLPENVDEDMLEMFFENTKKQGGGKVKSVNLNKEKKTAVIDFEEPEALSKVMDKQPIVLFGTDVCISIYDEKEPETCSPTKIKVTGLPENIDEDMLEMFFENTKRQGGGKVKSVKLNKQKKTAVIDFEEHKAVIQVLEKQPIIMFGSHVSVSIYKFEKELETRSPTKIKVTGIPENVDKEMLEMFFENTKKQGGGKVKSVNFNKQKKMAVIEFEEPEAVVNVLEKRPIMLFGKEMGVSVYGKEEPKSLPPTAIKVTGLPDNVNEESLELFFENTKKQGGGTVRSVTINRQMKVAIINFEDPEAVLKVLEKQPISLFGTQVGVSAHSGEEPESSRQTTIKVTGLPDKITEETLELFFENTKKQGGGYVRSVRLNKQTKEAMIDFEEPEAVLIVLKKQPITIFGTEVGVSVYNKEQSETCGPTRIKVAGLPENVDEDILEALFENTKKQGGGEVKSITLNKQKKTAIIEFQENKAVIKVLEKQPINVLGTQVDVSIYGEDEPEDLLPTTIMVTRLPENIDEDTLESFFENTKKQGGGRVRRVFLNKKKKLAFVDFEEAGAVERVLSKQPISILDTEVGVSVHAVFPKLSAIMVTGLPDNINEETLELFFENTKKQGGGKVRSVKLEKANKRALVEFEDPEAVNTVLKKQPIQILGKKVSISVYDPLNIDISGVDLSSSGIVEQISKIYVSQIPEIATTELLWDFFENTNRHGVGTVNHVDLNTTDMTAIVEFEDAEDVEKITKKKTVHIKGRAMKIRKLDATLFIEVQQKLSFYSVLKKIGLTDKYPGKIKLADVVTLDPNNSDVQTSSKLTDVPWMFLRRLISTHSDARDLAVVAKENEEEGDVDCMLSFANRSQTDDNDEISPIDVYFVIFQCCDPILKQIMFQKLYLCKMAVPFLYTVWKDGFQVPTLAIWPLRSLAIENKGKTDQSEIKCKEADVLELPTKTIAFARYGRPRYSKSKLLNSLLSIHGCKTFYNIDCPSGMTPRCISNGHIEMFWLPNIGDKRDQFQDPVTFLNMRGDLQVNFKEAVVSFIAQIVDTFIIIIDTESLSKFKMDLQNLVNQFPSVIFVIANSIQEHERALIETFKQSLCEAKPTLTLKFLGTHRGNIEQNVVDMVATVLRNISNNITAVNAQSIEFKLKNIKTDTIPSDEDIQQCQKGKEKAEQLLLVFNKEGEAKRWKQVVTPIQCNFSNKLGLLMKRGAREKVIEGTEKNEKNIKEVRLKTTQNITNGLKAFVNILINHEDDLELEFFLGWLKFFIEREKRMILPQLMFGYRCAWEKLKEMKAKEKDKGSPNEQEKIVETIKNYELEIDDASFSVEHLFRELGHVYDAFLETDTTVLDVGLPELERVTDVIASCVSKGHQFEIIDGESFFMPHKWIQKVFDKMKCYIGTKRIMTLSVLGLQSSGKSTLLNTMFGSQFSARTGRCTRGIHMQLIPVSTNYNKEESMPFDYVAVIDTEGLRSPELRNIMHEHDNELATVITGIGDITMLNIMGENTNEIRDILQVIVHAFLRLRRTNPNLDITKSCCFLHQNVTDTSASENMLSGLSKLLQILDEMTKESARSEGILDITSFNQVIEFDINSQVWYLKNLWQGNPPMARVNYEYSESVVAIKRKLMLKAISMQEKSYKSIQDILIQAHNLWKGVLSEDFVFSFRNSLEIKAYTEMEAFIQNLSWKLESLIQTKLVDLAVNNFASCNHKDQLRTISENTETELLEFLNEEKAKTEEEIITFFKNNQYKEIIIQWKQTQKIRIENLCIKLMKNIKDKIDKHCDKRAIEILTVSNHSKHEEQLWEKSREVAKNHQGKQLTQKERDDLFEEIWKSFVKNVNTSSYQSKVSVKGLQEVFIQKLYDMCNTEAQLVTQYLSWSKSLRNKPSFHQLKGTFLATYIDDNDVSFSFMRKGRDGFGLLKDSMKHVQKHVENLYECFDGKIRRLDQTDDEITDHDISTLLHQLQQGILNILKGTKDFDFKKTFYVKIYVHVSNFACHVFNEHNEKYHRIQGGQVRLDKYKQQQKISFEAHLSNRQYEDTIAILLSNVLEVFAREKSQEPIQNSATDFLFGVLPKVKNQVIFTILTDLATHNVFEEFIHYIKTPQSYAELWLERRCNELLFDRKSNDNYFTLGKKIIVDIFKQVKRCVEKFRGQQTEKQSTLAIEKFVEQLNTYLKEEKLVVPLEYFRTLLSQTGDIENILYLSDAIDAHITEAEEKLVHEIETKNKYSVLWCGTNPIDRIIKKVWGCPEQCPFCGEPCAKNDEHTDSDHYSIQHRPSCCKGIRKTDSQRACLESCNFDIQSEKTHTCGVFDFLCNAPQRENCSSNTHKYKDYKNFCGRWDIPPSSNMHDTSQYWLWFVGKYKDELAKFYSYEISHAPAEWEEITQDQAIKSLRDKYFV